MQIKSTWDTKLLAMCGCCKSNYVTCFEFLHTAGDCVGGIRFFACSATFYLYKSEKLIYVHQEKCTGIWLDRT